MRSIAMTSAAYRLAAARLRREHHRDARRGATPAARVRRALAEWRRRARRRDRPDIALELGVALRAQRHQGRVDDGLVRRARVAHQCALDLSDAIGRADSVAAGEHQPAHLEFEVAAGEIDAGLAA